MDLTPIADMATTAADLAAGMLDAAASAARSAWRWLGEPHQVWWFLAAAGILVVYWTWTDREG